MDENNPQPNNKDQLKTVRTYLSDMADTVRANDISVIKVALAEQNKHEREDLYRNVEGSSTKKFFWIVGGLVLIAIALYGTYFFLQQKVKDNAPAQIVGKDSIISYDEVTPIVMTENDSLLSKLDLAKGETSSSNKNDVLKFISVSKEVNGIKENILVKDLFSQLGFTAPSSLVRSLSDSYMLGTYTKNINIGTESIINKPKLFIILQTKDYEYTYAGMLAWEKTLASDMFDLFGLDTKENKLAVSSRTWKDIIINNKDARVLVNETDQPILYYIFTDKTNIIITSSDSVIKEVISRLMVKNIKPL